MKAQQTLKHIPSMLIPLFESGTVYFCATRDDWLDSMSDKEQAASVGGG